jgi:hypothetical protein
MADSNLMKPTIGYQIYTLCFYPISCIEFTHNVNLFFQFLRFFSQNELSTSVLITNNVKAESQVMRGSLLKQSHRL